MKLLPTGIAAIALILSLAFTGCASVPLRHFKPADYEVVPGRAQRGIASFYGDDYRGKRTASGEVFNPDDFTAAHRTLSLGSIVEVRNLRNNHTVLVEITDRGPFVKGRIIDLSEAAAKKLGMIGPGTTPVEIRLVRRVR
jgi:rare lipoprotein A